MNEKLLNSLSIDKLRDYLVCEIEYSYELRERIDKAIEYIETVEPNYNSLHSEILQSEYISNYGACDLLEILRGAND